MFSRRRLSEQRILVTGASSGIGRALALRLASEGARVVASGRSRERLAALAAEDSRVTVIAADVADAAERQRLLDETVAALGGLDVLVNNAGVGATGFFDEADEKRLRKIFEVNFFATTELTRLALPHLKRGREPMIVNVASVLGRRAIPGCSEYCASKFAVVGWSESLRAEQAKDGVHVLVVCPGGVETAFDENMLEKGRRITRAGRRRMSADRCAELIVAAMRRRRNEVVITAEAKLALWANRIAPRILDWFLARQVR
jgi:short-subunit dehydrogenase